MYNQYFECPRCGSSLHLHQENSNPNISSRYWGFPPLQIEDIAGSQQNPAEKELEILNNAEINVVIQKAQGNFFLTVIDNKPDPPREIIEHMIPEGTKEGKKLQKFIKKVRGGEVVKWE